MDIDNLALRPNCLLTKYPLVFITGKRSIFFHKRLGENLQDFILAHGYNVLCPPLPFRDSYLRKKYLKFWLQQQNFKQFHFIIGKEIYTELKEALSDQTESSFTLIDMQFNSEKDSISLQYYIHKLYCKVMGTTVEPYGQTLSDKNLDVYNRFLDHCIELAENE